MEIVPRRDLHRACFHEIIQFTTIFSASDVTDVLVGGTYRQESHQLRSSLCMVDTETNATNHPRCPSTIRPEASPSTLHCYSVMMGIFDRLKAQSHPMSACLTGRMSDPNPQVLESPGHDFRSVRTS